jgi:hypothetical protein
MDKSARSLERSRSSIRKNHRSLGCLSSITLFCMIDTVHGFSTYTFPVSPVRKALFLTPRFAQRGRHLEPFSEAFVRNGLISSTMMGRKRKGEGAQRSRWAPREASTDFQVPQGVADQSGGANRAAKIEALVSRRQSGLIVVLEDPADEHNAGAVFRSCDAFGATEVWIIHNGIRPGTSMRPHVERGEEFEPDSRAVALASSSASRWVASRTLLSTDDAIAALRADGYCNVATCFTERSRLARICAPSAMQRHREIHLSYGDACSGRFAIPAAAYPYNESTHRRRISSGGGLCKRPRSRSMG